MHRSFLRLPKYLEADQIISRSRKTAQQQEIPPPHQQSRARNLYWYIIESSLTQNHKFLFNGEICHNVKQSLKNYCMHLSHRHISDGLENNPHLNILYWTIVFLISRHSPPIGPVAWFHHSQCRWWSRGTKQHTAAGSAPRVWQAGEEALGDRWRSYRRKVAGSQNASAVNTNTLSKWKPLQTRTSFPLTVFWALPPSSWHNFSLNLMQVQILKEFPSDLHRLWRKGRQNFQRCHSPVCKWLVWFLCKQDVTFSLCFATYPAAASSSLHKQQKAWLLHTVMLCNRWVIEV